MTVRLEKPFDTLRTYNPVHLNKVKFLIILIVNFQNYSI